MQRPNSDDTYSLAHNLKLILRVQRKELLLGDLLKGIGGEGGSGAILFVLTLPVLLPLPPGASMIFALPLLLVAPQVMFGRRTVWLPQWLSRRTIKRTDLVKIIGRVLPALKRAETFVRPRLSFFTGRSGEIIAGALCTLLAIVLILPLPFANLAPALAIGAVSVGLARKDGLLLLGGYGLAVLAVGVIVLGLGGVGLGLARLRALL